MKLLHQRILTLFLSLAFLAASTSGAAAGIGASPAPYTGGLSTGASAGPTGSDIEPSGDNDGMLSKSRSYGSNKSNSKSKVWWDISSDGSAIEFSTSPAWGSGDGSGIARLLTANSHFKLKAKFYSSTKTLIDVTSEASRSGHIDYRAVKSNATVLGATVYNKDYYNYDGDAETITSGYHDDFTFFSKTLPVWWFLKVKVAMGGEVGIDPNLRADNDQARADMEPYAGVYGSGDIILDLLVAKGGVGGKITLAKVGVPIDAEMILDDTDEYDSRICYTMKAKTTLETLSGTFYVWAKYWLPIKGWSKKYKKNVFSWGGLKWGLKTHYNSDSCQWI